MGVYVTRRLLIGITTLLGITIIVFLSLHLAPGDPVEVFMGDEAQQVTKEFLDEFRRMHGLDQPLHIQYFRFMSGVARFDFGRSIRTGRPIVEEIASRVPATLELGIAGLLIAVTIGVTTGVIAAVKRNTWIDTLIQPISFAGVSIPGFWQGILMMMFFSIYLNWLPSSGRGGGLFSPGGWKHLMMPALTIGTSSCALLIRLTRTSMLDVMSEDYIRTARAKGLAEKVVIYRHALRNAMIPVLTVLGLSVGGMLAGSIIVETVFAWPGMGRFMVRSIGVRDFPVIQTMTLLLATTYVLANVLVDIAYAVVDPRIRYK